MALFDRLPGIQTRTVTIGAYLTGSDAETVYGGTFTATPSPDGFVVHKATGDAVRLPTVTGTLNAQGKASVTLVQDGASALTPNDIAYRFVLNLTDPTGGGGQRIEKTIRVTAGTGPLDLELEWAVTAPIPSAKTVVVPGPTQAVNLSPTYGRLDTLEARPIFTPTNLGPLDARVTTLEGRPVGGTTDLGPLTTRVSSLESQATGLSAALAAKIGPAEIAPVLTRVADLESGRASLASTSSVAALSDQVTTLGTRVDDKASTGSVTALTGRVTTLEGATPTTTQPGSGGTLAAPIPLRYPRPSGWETWRTLTVQGTGSAAGPEVIDCGRTPTRVIFPADTTVPPVRINGANDLIVIGGGIRALPGSSIGGQDQRLLQVTDARGLVHLEGLHLNGLGLDNSRETDGMLLSGPGATFTVQNYRADALHGKQSTNHADMIQIYQTCKALRVHNMTGSSDYQGIKFQLVSGEAPLESVTLSNVDLLGINRTDTDTTGGYVFWANPNGETPVTLENVRLDGRGNRSLGVSLWPGTNYSSDTTRAGILSADGTYITWDPKVNIAGRITERGPSDATDFVQPGVAGPRYGTLDLPGGQGDQGGHGPLDATLPADGTTDIGPLIQAAYDAGTQTIRLAPNTTYLWDSPVFLDKTSAYTGLTITGERATIKLGANLPTTSWLRDAATRFAVFANTNRSALSGGIVSVTDATRSTGVNNGALRSLLVHNVTIDGQAANRGFSFANRTAASFHEVTLYRARVLHTWWDYADAAHFEHCYSRGGSGPVEQVVFEQYQAGDGVTVIGGKADSSVGFSRMKGNRGSSFTGLVTGKMEFEDCSAVSITGSHEEGQQSTKTMLEIKSSQVTLRDCVVYENWSGAAPSIIIDDSGSTETGSELTLDTVIAQSLFQGGDSRSEHSAFVHIVGSSAYTRVRARGLRSMMTSSGIAGKWVDSAMPRITSADAAITTGLGRAAARSLMASGDWHLHRGPSGSWVVDGATPGLVVARAHTASPSIIQVTTGSGCFSGGGSMPATAVRYAVAGVNAAGQYTNAVAAAAVTPSATNGMVRILVGLDDVPCVVDVWRSEGAADPLASPSKRVSLMMRSPRQYVYDTGDHLAGQPWSDPAGATPASIASTNATTASILIDGEVVSGQAPADPSPPPAATTRRTDYGAYRPSATTAGSYGTLTPYAGDLIVTTAGAVIDGLDISGLLRIKANNVTVTRCTVRGGDRGAGYQGAIVMALQGDQTGAIFRDLTVRPSNPVVGMDSVQISSATVERCDISNSTDGIKLYGNDCTAQGNYIHDLIHYEVDPAHSDGSHDDGIQFEGGSRCKIVGNAITDMWNSCIQVTQNTATVNDLLIDRNWLGNGFITLNTSEKGKGAYSNFRVTNNVFLNTQRNTDGVHAAITTGTRAAATITGNTVAVAGVPFKVINAGS